MTKKQKQLRRQRWMQAGRRSVRQAERRARERVLRHLNAELDVVMSRTFPCLWPPQVFEWSYRPIRDAVMPREIFAKMEPA